MSNYWQERLAESQNKLSETTRRKIDKQLKKYYGEAAKQVIEDFQSTYEKLLATIEAGKTPTPADLYKLDKYWQMQGQMRGILQKLGEKEVVLLTKQFELGFFEIYYSINIEGAVAYTTIDNAAVQHMINQIWCADGKSWSQRIWENTSLLMETLNEELIHTVVSGRTTSDLKKLLQERFNVSYSAADSLVRTELANIQTQAAKQRYIDYGIQEVEILADADERRCEICGKLHEKRYPAGAEVPIPAHPRCRCCIVPVIE